MISSNSYIDHLVGPIFVLVVCLITWAITSARSKRTAARVARGERLPPRRWPWKRGLISGVVLAAFYLLVFRLVSLAPPYVNDHGGGAILMSFSFLFMGPFVAGFFTVDRAAAGKPLSGVQFIIVPWIPVLLNLALALAVMWEGMICAVFILPPALISASVGGIVAGLLYRRRNRRSSNGTLLCLAAAPLLFCMLEVQLNQPRNIRTVDTQILIHASAPIVWQNIERVRAIAPSELRASWANIIGFPRPVEATLSYEGVGGVRNASFERGLNFIETVIDWNRGKRIAFTIAADTAAIPATTLDAHVTVGGRFFDVLTGEYQLEPLANGDTLLQLSSRQRLSTDFNAYAALWSDAVMSDMQNNILQVVRNRCEAEARTTTASVTINHKGN